MMPKIFLILYAFTSIIAAQEKEQTLDPNIVKILKKYSLKNHHLKYHLRDLDEATPPLGYKEASNFTPASLTKVFTAAYALEKLGPDFRYQTKLYIQGSLNKKTGQFNGNVTIQGQGDPSLTMARLMDLVLSLKARGIKSIKGNFYYDDSLIPTIPMISSFGNGDQTYNPGLSALNLEYNRITLHKDARQTKEAIFQTIPATGHFFVQKDDSIYKNGKRFQFMKEASGETWSVSNREKYRQYEDIPVRKPSKRTAYTFKTLAALWGIQIPVPKPKKIDEAENHTLIGRDSSPSLGRLLALTLEFSNNLFAEQIMLTSTKTKDIEKGAQKLSTWLNKKVPECSPKLINGSGLTQFNQVTPLCLSSFIKKFALTPLNGAGLMSMLSISGASGWMRKRLRHPETAFRVWAKTGSLDYVDNMTGIIFTGSGKRYAFAMSIADTKRRAIIDQAENSKKIVKLKKQVKKWRKKSRKATEELLTHFIRTL